MPQQDKLPKATGRPEHHPDEIKQRVVVALKMDGVPEAQIAEILHIDVKTLKKHYGPELEHSRAFCHAAVAGTLYHKATAGGDTTAAIFYAKTQLGWKEHRDPFEEEAPKTIEGEFAEVSDREFGRILAHQLMLGQKGSYNQPKEMEHDEVSD